MSAGQNSAHLIPQKDFLFNLSGPCEINLGPVHQKKITLRAVVPLTRPKKTDFPWVVHSACARIPDM